MEAYLYSVSDNNNIRCGLCSHRCKIREGRRGICNVRENRNGRLYSLVYEKLIARNVDPIEKKPLFHMLPGSLSYSIATAGCNFRCRFCQNSDIAQMPSDRGGQIAGRRTAPEEILADAVRSGCKTIAYTYTEPTVYFEYAYETARLARKKGIRNIFVSNGFMTRECIDMLSPYLDGANIDLKAFRDDFYKNYCGARLEPVKESLKLIKSKGILLEVTTLLIPGLNDSTEELEDLAGFIANDLGKETPWHISRFHPTYRLTNRPSTPLKSLERAREIGILAGLDYVYMGNVPGTGGEDTLCPGCGKTLIERRGFSVSRNLVQKGVCPDCAAVIYGVGMSGEQI